MFSNLISAVTPKIVRSVNTAKGYSPEVMLVGGLIGGIAAGLMFAKAARRHEEVFDDVVEEIRMVRYEMEEPSEDEKENGVTQMTRSDGWKQLTPLYGEVIGRGIRLYGPSVLIGATSLYLILASHGIIRKQNKALIATAQLANLALKEYRGRVIEKYGEEADAELFYGAQTATMVNMSVDEDGKKTKTKSTKTILPEDGTKMVSMYARIFDQSCPAWKPSRDLNLYFLRAQQKMLNDYLQIRRVVLLNDLYDAIGVPRSEEGCVVGWSMDLPGDGFIDLGLDKIVNRDENDPRFVVDPNVSGVVISAYSIGKN